MVIIQTTSLIYDRSAGKLAVAGGTSPRGTERRSPVVDLQAETNSYRRVHRRKRIRSQQTKTEAACTRSSYLLRLCGVLRERKPPFRHFDEKGFMRRTTSCLRQTNAFGRVLA